MTPKKFYDWQTAGGADDVMRRVDCLARLIESHPHLWELLDTDLKEIIQTEPKKT